MATVVVPGGIRISKRWQHVPTQHLKLRSRRVQYTDRHLNDLPKPANQGATNKMAESSFMPGVLNESIIPNIPDTESDLNIFLLPTVPGPPLLVTKRPNTYQRSVIDCYLQSETFLFLD